MVSTSFPHTPPYSNNIFTSKVPIDNLMIYVQWCELHRVPPFLSTFMYSSAHFWCGSSIYLQKEVRLPGLPSPYHHGYLVVSMALSITHACIVSVLTLAYSLVSYICCRVCNSGFVRWLDCIMRSISIIKSCYKRPPWISRPNYSNNKLLILYQNQIFPKRQWLLSNNRI